MDEDGFYMGELNGVRGLVPSNFLQTPLGNINTLMAPSSNVQSRPKGVVFSGEAPQQMSNKRVAPIRQTSQTSATGKVGPANSIANFGKMSSTGNISKTSKVMTGAGNVSSSNTSMPNKTLTKKTSDLTNKSLSVNNASSTASKKSQALKKNDGGSGVKVNNYYKHFVT